MVTVQLCWQRMTIRQYILVPMYMYKGIYNEVYIHVYILCTYMYVYIDQMYIHAHVRMLGHT